MKLFTVQDTTSETFSFPITVKNVGEMERALHTLFENDKEHKFVKYPDEHVLHEIGDFDETTGNASIYAERKTITPLSKFKLQ